MTRSHHPTRPTLPTRPTRAATAAGTSTTDQPGSLGPDRSPLRVRSAMIGAALVAGGLAFTLASPLGVEGSARSTLGAGAADVAASKPFLASLTGSQEVPGPGDTDGTGTAAVTIDAVTGEVCADLRVAGIDTPTAAHIHRGATGVAGPVVVTLNIPNPTSATCVAAGTTLAAEIAAAPAAFYVNVHNAAFPAGAVRGQLATPTTMTGTQQLLAEPLRAYDSRTAPEGILVPTTARTIDLGTGVNGAGQRVVAVPPGAVGAMVRLTVTDSVGTGFLKMYSAALTTAPATSAANWYETNSIVGSDAVVAIDASGRIKIEAGVNQTHVVVDVIGFIF